MKVVHHYRCTPASTPSTDDLDGVLEGLRSAMATMWAPLGNEFYHYTDASGVFWDTDGNETTGSAVEDVPGTDTGNVNPAQVAFVVSWRVTTRWKGGHPRSYFPGVTNDELASAHTYQPTYVSDWQDAADAFLTAVAAVSSGSLSVESLAVLRRFADGGSEAVPKVYLDPPELIDIVSAIARNDIGTQRRRLGHFDG